MEEISRNENKRASRNLYLELENTLEALRSKENVWESTDGSVRFVNKFWNHDIYDGLAASAKLGFLRDDLQQRTQDAFRQIKLHNQYLRGVLEFQSTDRADLFLYCKTLEGYETFLRYEIPELVAELKKESGSR